MMHQLKIFEEKLEKLIIVKKIPFISDTLRKIVDMPKPEKDKLNHNNEMLQALAVGHENHNDVQNKMNHENLKNDLLKEIENKLNHNEQMLQTLLSEIKNLKK